MAIVAYTCTLYSHMDYMQSIASQHAQPMGVEMEWLE